MNSRKTVLIVDDDASIRESMKMILSRLYEVEIAESADSALRHLAEHDAPNLALIDVMMPGKNGLDLLEELSKSHPKLPVIMLTASRAVPSAVRAMKVGAVDYLNKPFDIDDLLALIKQTIEANCEDRDSTNYTNGDFGRLYGQHQEMKQLYSTIEKLSQLETTILILGESGTGKEVIAKEIHERSSRGLEPFVSIDCAAIPDQLVERELFGEEGVSSGYFELADKGTLFLDEVSTLSTHAQLKMLRFLEHQEYSKIGSPSIKKADVRILASSNADLEQLVASGAFRADLYYRINVAAIQAPALRKHKSDLKPMIINFIERFKPLYANRELRFSSETIDALKNYHWPGNVRELENLVENMFALCRKDVVYLEDLPESISEENAESELVEQVLSGEIGFDRAEQVFERELIVKALRRSDHVQTKAAEMLGISRRILKYKMDKLGISSSRLKVATNLEHEGKAPLKKTEAP